MIDGFNLYIHEQLESFIYSNIIPSTGDVIDYNNRLYTVVTVRFNILKDKDDGVATLTKRVTSCNVYVII